ncbi:MAG: helix-turn-helix transcriptional regulator [Phycisphaerae bacterium]
MSKKSDTTDLAGQLRAAFAESGLSRFELARRAGISYAIVHRFIGGDRSITLGTASKLAHVLDLELRPVRRAKQR